MKVWIPDVSEHQGKINWEKLAGKIPGTIIRIGYGDDIQSQDDIYAVYNMSECRRLGIPFDVYIYSYADSDAHSKSEIAHVKRMCKGFNPGKFWLDLEVRKYAKHWKRAAELWKEAFGDNAGVYTWQWGFEKHIKSGRRWICAYGTNNGKRQLAYKPTISCDGWQYTSRAVLPGIHGYVDMSEWYTDFADIKPVEIKPVRKEVLKKEVAAMIMLHLCSHDKHGYTQDMKGRQGTGTEVIDIYGHKYTIPAGDADCSSAVIRAYEAAGISCGGATYTGNMRKCMVASGNFEVKPMSYIAQSGDTYLNEKNHTAMCISAEPDILAEFSINEKGKALGGKIGDQKQVGEYDDTLGRGESHLADYYDYPWDLILHCKNNEVAFVVGETKEEKPATTPTKATVAHDTALCAALTILDEYGKGDARKRALGAKYNAVQDVVNRTLLQHRYELAEAMAKFIETI